VKTVAEAEKSFGRLGFFSGFGQAAGGERNYEGREEREGAQGKLCAGLNGGDTTAMNLMIADLAQCPGLPVP
jgi:hypothetical protein